MLVTGTYSKLAVDNGVSHQSSQLSDRDSLYVNFHTSF